MSAVELAEARATIEGYLDRILADGAVDRRWTSREGQVQCLISSKESDTFRCFQREAVPAFPSTAIRDAIVEPLAKRIWDAISLPSDAPPWWPGVRDRGRRPRPGLEADLLGVDEIGRLLVMEVKPADEIKGIAWAPGQARLYAELFALLLEVDPGARDAMGAMIEQRRRLGLSSPPWKLPEQARIRIVPVVSIGAGQPSAQALPRLAEVHGALQLHPPVSARLDDLEVWRHDECGERISVWRPGVDEVPSA